MRTVGSVQQTDGAFITARVIRAPARRSTSGYSRADLSIQVDVCGVQEVPRPGKRGRLVPRSVLKFNPHQLTLIPPDPRRNFQFWLAVFR